MPGLPTPTPRAPTPIRIGRVDRLDESALEIALSAGFFLERGLQPVVVELTLPADPLEALAADRIDAACLPVAAELFDALAQSDRLRIVAEASGAPPGNGAAGLAVRNDLVERLETPTDLRGLRIAVPEPSGVLAAELAALLRRGWLSRWDIEWVTLAPADAIAALAHGAIHAAMLPEPYLTRLEQEGHGFVWQRSDTLQPNHTTSALVLQMRFARSRPQAAREFLTAYLRAVRLYNDAFIHGQTAARSRVIHLLSQRLADVDASMYQQIVMPGINPNGMVNLQTLQVDQQYFLATGQQARAVDLVRRIDPQYVAYAVAQLGEYR